MRWSCVTRMLIVFTLAVPTVTKAEDPARPGMCAAHEPITNGQAILWPSNGTGPHKTSGGTGASRGNPGTSASGGLSVYVLNDTIYHSTGPIGFAHSVRDCVGAIRLRAVREFLSPHIQELSQGP